MATRAKFMRRASIAVLSAITVSALLGTSAWAADADSTAELPEAVRVVEVGGATTYAAAHELTASELEQLSGVQSDEQIALALSLASSDQPIQVLEDLSRPAGSFSAAVLVNEPNIPGDLITARSLCSLANADVMSNHHVGTKIATYGYCNVGSNDVTRGGFYEIVNYANHTITYVAQSTGGRSCPANSTCTVPTAYSPTVLTNVTI